MIWTVGALIDELKQHEDGAYVMIGGIEGRSPIREVILENDEVVLEGS
ncbi:MAG TPA: hypothetical protein GX707_06480 [Epulopiscium sp.]|nr:hypothetical protein [Candidatus Epulonipiscium sp.]